MSVGEGDGVGVGDMMTEFDGVCEDPVEFSVVSL
jgi:hypothetical protein